MQNINGLLSVEDLYDAVNQTRGDTQEVKDAEEALETKLEDTIPDKFLRNDLSDFASAIGAAYEEQGFILGFRQAVALLIGGNHD